MAIFETLYRYLSNAQPIAVLATAIAAAVVVWVVFSMRKNDLTHLDEAFKNINTKIDGHHNVVKENFAEVHKNIGEVHKRMDEHLRDHATGIFSG